MMESYIPSDEESQEQIEEPAKQSSPVNRVLDSVAESPKQPEASVPHMMETEEEAEEESRSQIAMSDQKDDLWE